MRACYGQYAIEQLARIPVEAAIASEYRYRDPIVGEDELFIAVSQSGETGRTPWPPCAKPSAGEQG